MFWLSFAENSSSEKNADVAPSLFTDADDDELLEAADLAAIDESMQRPGGLYAEQADDVVGGQDTQQDDAVDPAAADASIAFVEAHGEDGPPAAEDRNNGPLLWLVPWAISLVAHAALIIVAIFVVWSVQKVLEDDQVVVPLVTLSETPGTPLEVEVVQRLETQAPAMTAPPVPEPMPLELDLEMDLELPGVGEPMAASAPTFELNLNDAAQFDTNFFGSGGNAKNIVFVVEADGSIISDYPQIVDELAESLRDMNEKQRFSIIVFDGQDTKEVPPRGLKRATADAKRQSIKWLEPKSGNVITRGTGDPVKALERAFRLKADLIFLLSQNLYNPGRNQYELERDEILQAVAKGSRSGIVVNTIEFNDLDKLAFDSQGNKVRPTLMEEIARTTGGEYIAVTTNIVPLGN